MLRHEVLVTKHIREPSFANQRHVHRLSANIPTRRITTLTIRRIKLMSELALRLLEASFLPILLQLFSEPMIGNGQHHSTGIVVCL